MNGDIFLYCGNCLHEVVGLTRSDHVKHYLYREGRTCRCDCDSMMLVLRSGVELDLAKVELLRSAALNSLNSMVSRSESHAD